MNVGEVYWVEFPAGAGRAQAGRRPSILVQGAAASTRLPTVLLIPFTTQLDALRFPGTVLVEPDQENGLRRASVALTVQLTVLDRRFVGERVGRVSDDVVLAIWSAFDEITERRPAGQSEESR
jgi:mRNA-degrading endonuclease toxin of MazEF toxin-antitoxin module